MLIDYQRFLSLTRLERKRLCRRRQIRIVSVLIYIFLAELDEVAYKSVFDTST